MSCFVDNDRQACLVPGCCVDAMCASGRGEGGCTPPDATQAMSNEGLAHLQLQRTVRRLCYLSCEHCPTSTLKPYNAALEHEAGPSRKSGPASQPQPTIWSIRRGLWKKPYNVNQRRNWSGACRKPTGTGQKACALGFQLPALHTQRVNPFPSYALVATCSATSRSHKHLGMTKLGKTT